MDVRATAGRLGGDDMLLVDLRDSRERENNGVIAGSVHAPYGELSENLLAGGMLYELVRATGKQLVFYCAYGERSAMAVAAALGAGIENPCHVKGGIDAWKKAELPLESAQ